MTIGTPETYRVTFGLVLAAAAIVPGGTPGAEPAGYVAWDFDTGG